VTTDQKLMAACVDYRDKLEALARDTAALKNAFYNQMSDQRHLRADRDRLDWLGSNQVTIEYREGEWYCEGQTFATVRGAIDAAMGEGKQ